MKNPFDKQNPFHKNFEAKPLNLYNKSSILPEQKYSKRVYSIITDSIMHQQNILDRLEQSHNEEMLRQGYLGIHSQIKKPLSFTVRPVNPNINNNNNSNSNFILSQIIKQDKLQRIRNQPLRQILQIQNQYSQKRRNEVAKKFNLKQTNQSTHLYSKLKQTNQSTHQYSKIQQPFNKTYLKQSIIHDLISLDQSIEYQQNYSIQKNNKTPFFSNRHQQIQHLDFWNHKKQQKLSQLNYSQVQSDKHEVSESYNNKYDNKYDNKNGYKQQLKLFYQGRESQLGDEQILPLDSKKDKFQQYDIWLIKKQKNYPVFLTINHKVYQLIELKSR